MEKNKKVTFDAIKSFVNEIQITGYIWYINEEKPQIFKDKIINFNNTSEAKNQIQEAYLTNSEKNISIRILNSDGIEHCFIYELSYFIENNDYKVNEDEIEYPSHIKEIETLSFKQVYKLTESLSGSEFKTWQPVMQFFTGLTFKKE